VYIVREVNSDPLLLSLFDRGILGLEDPEMFRVSAALMRPIVVDAQDTGERRSEFDPDEAVRWLIEQATLAVAASRHSESDVRARMRNFVVPSLRHNDPQGRDLASIATSLRRHADGSARWQLTTKECRRSESGAPSPAA
jgi:hypothetical protein